MLEILNVDSVLSVLVLFIFTIAENQPFVKTSNNPVCKLRSIHFRFVGRDLAFVTSGCIWQHFRLFKTYLTITKLL